MAVLRGVAQYRNQLRSLLPSGPAWELERLPELDQVLQGIAAELARLDARCGRSAQRNGPGRRQRVGAGLGAGDEPARSVPGRHAAL